MPEGDTLYHVAQRLAPALQGLTIEAARSRVMPLKVTSVDAESLVGCQVESVEAHGKHLFIALDDRRTIHSHLGMTGSWHVYSLGEPWRKPARQAALAVATAERVVVNFSPKVLEIVSTAELARNAYLRRLGPDMLADEFDAQDVLGRYRVHARAPIGEAIMNQSIAAGVGNIFKSETLFLAELDPWTRVAELDDVRLLGVIDLARRLMRKNRAPGMRRTRFKGDGRRFWVYGRRGEPCYRCGATVLLRRQGDLGRTTYWCPTCQMPAEDAPTA